MMSFIVDLLPHLEETFEITLLGVKTDSQNYYSDFIELNGKKYPFKVFSEVVTGKKKVPNILRVVYNLWRGKKKILKGDYDLLYIHGIPLNLPLLKGRGTHNQSPKIINHVHGSTNPFSVTNKRSLPYSILAKIYSGYRQKVVRNSDLVLLASDKVGHEKFSSDFQPATAKHIKYIPNFADSGVFRQRDKLEARKQLDLSSTIKIFISAGRLSFQKDPILSLEAFAQSRLGEPENAHLYFIGEGELSQQLQELVNEKNLGEYVHFLGRLERTEIAIWLNAADVFVYTSHGNGFPIALVEAGMSGLPIVTTDVTGVHDIVIHGSTGFLVEHRDIKELSFYMHKALKQNHILSKNILVQSKRFTPENIAHKISEFLRSSLIS
ncbi:glycosyltransferase [Thermodesulfobacteriota bacterium]